MTHEVHSRPLPPAATPAPAAATPATAASPSAMDRVDGALEWLWHFLSSMKLAMVIMLALVVLGTIGSILMQIPNDVLGDPAREQLWLDSVRPRYGGWTDILYATGMLNVFNGYLFIGLAAALTISLIACSIHRIPGMVKTVMHPRVDVGPQFFEHAPQHEAIVARRPLAETTSAVEGVLKRHHYRILTSEDGTVHLYADRFRWASFAGLIAHLAIVVVVMGALLGRWGYRNPEFMIVEGETLPVAAAVAPGITLQLLDFTDKYDPATGAPIDYASTVVLYKDGQEIDRHVVRVNDPLRYEGTTFYQAFFGPAATVTVTDKDGKVILDKAGVPLAYRDEAERAFGTIAIPGTGYTAEVLATGGGNDPDIKPGQVKFGIYTSGANSWTDVKVIDQGTATPIGDLTVTFERETQFAGLNVARDPGVLFVWIGSLLLFGGFLIRFLVPHKRVWGRIVSRPAGGSIVAMATLTPKNVTAGTDFESLVTDIRAALAAPAQG